MRPSAAIPIPAAAHARRARPRPSITVLASRMGDASADFADFVLASLDGPVLRYSHRLVLLREADQRGIGRFEANLIIAAVLHRHGLAQEYELPPDRAVRTWILPLLTFATLQAAILYGLWWILH